MLEALYASLLMGIIGSVIGFLAQRSRICFVAGLRDYLLVRDKELLLGVGAFIATIWLLTSIFYATGLLRQGIPEYGSIETKSLLPERIAPNDWMENIRQAQILGGGGESSASSPRVVNRFFYVSLLGGWLLGALSVLAGGCVLRQHILCAQGNRDAFLYMLGFYCAVVIYDLFFFNTFSWLYQ
ncbi:MAG: hypothetical protein GY801_00935 [bacterium]|nr:hypothetical protein [bacterium]